MEIETLRLVTIIRHINLSNNPEVVCSLESLLKESPAGSNYLINTTTTLVWFESTLCKVFPNHFRSSSVPLKRHLEIIGLTAECKLLLFENQVQRIANLITIIQQEENVAAARN